VRVRGQLRHPGGYTEPGRPRADSGTASIAGRSAGRRSGARAGSRPTGPLSSGVPHDGVLGA
jgi:hypothetical protein